MVLPIQNGKEPNNINKGRETVLYIVGAIIIFVAATYFLQFLGGPTTTVSKFDKCLGFDDEEDWTVLSRPNTLWSTGTAIEFDSGGKHPKYVGDFLQGCLPELNVTQVVGTSAPMSCSDSIDYRLSLSGTLGISNEELVSAGIEVGNSGQPNIVSRVNITAAREKSLDLLQIENYLSKERFEAMKIGCKTTLTDADRFVIAGIYQIDVGTIEIARYDGTKLDLSLPKYSVLRHAAIESGFAISSSGSIEISETTKPLTFAVRSGNFAKVLGALGITARGGVAFTDRMREAGASIRD